MSILSRDDIFLARIFTYVVNKVRKSTRIRTNTEERNQNKHIHSWSTGAEHVINFISQMCAKSRFLQIEEKKVRTLRRHCKICSEAGCCCRLLLLLQLPVKDGERGELYDCRPIHLVFPASVRQSVRPSGQLPQWAAAQRVERADLRQPAVRFGRPRRLTAAIVFVFN